MKPILNNKVQGVAKLYKVFGGTVNFTKYAKMGPASNLLGYCPCALKMMHHPNMHHQPMSGHPPQHMGGHQGMPGHHQMPPHQMHRENRHVTLTRVAMGPSQPGAGMAGHGQAMGGMGAMGVPHHGPGQRPPHPIRPMPHHPQAQHHSVPPQMKPMRRPYNMGGAYGPGAPGVMPPPYAQPQRQPQPPAVQPSHTVVSTQSSTAPSAASVAEAADSAKAAPAPAADKPGDERAAPGDSEASRPAPPANSKEKTPMCLVNELARYNKIKHQYRLTSETGPAHKKVFTVTLRLGDTEEYTAEGSSIKRAQHAAASAALTATSFPPPPPRAPAAHASAHPHHRHSGAVMPTVELNALAMKLCQPAVYTSIPPVCAGVRAARPRPPPPYRFPLAPVAVGAPVGVAGVGVGGPLLYRVRVSVGGRAWLGEGATPQAARHDAAARALHDLRPSPGSQVAAATATPGAAATTNGTATTATAQTEGENGDASADILNSEVKSPVSLVHELALKRNLSVQFTVKSERGPPHMRVFVTACTVGDIETEGEGNGKKVSKRRAAERMLDEMRRRWPPALLRPRPPHDKRRHQPAKKKPRNLIKEGGVTACATNGCAGADNPISRLAVARHAVRARSPQYRVLEERGQARRREFLVQCDAPPHSATGLGPNKKAAKRRAAHMSLYARLHAVRARSPQYRVLEKRGQARRREFLVQCDAPPHSATGLGPNKKAAKRRAAHNVLLAMEMSTNATDVAAVAAANSAEANGAGDAPSVNQGDSKRKEGSMSPAGAVTTGGAAGEVRQPVPGVLLMDYHQRSGQPPQPNGVSETSATGGGSSPGAKDQLMYLAQLLGFTVQFSDFPKRNHGEYLSLVSLSTEPPVMCHGGGPSTAHSHEQCARAALRALALMGLDAPSPAPGMQSVPASGGGPKPSTVNGIAE